MKKLIFTLYLLLIASLMAGAQHQGKGRGPKHDYPRHGHVHVQQYPVRPGYVQVPAPACACVPGVSPRERQQLAMQKRRLRQMEASARFDGVITYRESLVLERAYADFRMEVRHAEGTCDFY